MLEGLEYAKETLDLQRGEIKDNVSDINDLIVSDVLSALGYDRRRNRNVERVKNDTNGISWKIKKDDKFIIIKTASIGSPLDNISQDLISESKNLVGILFTDGEKLAIYNNNINNLNRPAIIIDIFSDSEESIEALTSLKDLDTLVSFIDKRYDLIIKSILKMYIRQNNLTLFSESFLHEVDIDEQSKEKIFRILGSLYEDLNKSTPSQDEEGLDSQINDHVTKIESLNNRVAAKDTEIESLHNEIATKDAEIEKLNNQINSQESTASIIDAAEIDRLNEALNEKDAEISELKKTLEDANSDNQSNSTIVNELNAAVESRDAKINELTEAVESKDTEIRELKVTLDSRDEEISKLNETIEGLNTQLSESTGSDSDGADLDKDQIKRDIRDYIKQIETLTSKVGELEKSLESKNKDIEFLNDKLMNSEDPKLKISQDILDSVENVAGATRSYIGVVNGNLFQAPTMERFIGLALEELYKEVSFELMPLIFDGDIFKITDKTVRNDMLIANKTYDIDLSYVEEEDALIRLNTLFKKFPQVVYLYKIIGTNNVVPRDLFNVEHLENEPVITTQGETQESDEILDSDGSNMLLDEQDDEEIDLGNTPEQVRPTKEYGFAVGDLKDILESGDIQVENLKYIGNENIAYKIPGETIREQVENLLGVIVYIGDESKKSIKSIFSYKFSEISQNVLDNINADESVINIPYTRQYLSVNDLADAIDVISKFCELSSIDIYSIYLYMNCYSDSADYNENLVDTSNWDLGKDSSISVDNQNRENTVHCIISGSILDSTVINKYSYDVYRNIIMGCLAVKTNYLSNYTKNKDDISHIITDILAQSDRSIEEVIYEMGDLVGASNKAISISPNDVGENYLTSQINGNDIYISAMEPWQLVLSVIKLHTIAVGDHSISTRVILYKDVYDYYRNDFYSSNAAKVGAINSFMDYASERLKF